MRDYRVVSTAELTPDDRAALRALLDDAFGGDFSDDDWNHSLGGRHVLAVDSGEDGGIVAHAARCLSCSICSWS